MLRFIIFSFAVSLALLLAACGNEAEQKADATIAQTPEVTESADSVAKVDVAEPEPQQAEPVKVEPVKTESPKSTGLKAEAAKPKPPTPKVTLVTLPQGTPIVVTLVDSIDTDIDSTGDEFRAALAEPIFVDGKTLFDAGAPATGVLTQVVESGHLKTPAELSFTLTSIQDINGNWISIAADTVYEKKASHTGKEVALIGGGAVVGGIVGKLTKKKGGTLIGAAAGAAAGTAAAAATGKQDIVRPAGETVTFTTRQGTEIATK